MAEVNESRMGRYVRPSLAEFVGTCLYVFVVCLLPVRVDTTAITVSGLLQGAAYVSLLMGPGKIRYTTHAPKGKGGVDRRLSDNKSLLTL